MKKISFLFFIVGIVFLMPKQTQAQESLKANAGEDRHFCFETDWIQTTLGGNPTAIGGEPPYTYQWWAVSDQDYYIQSETNSNPSVIFLGNGTVYVEVTDAAGNSDIDSVLITMSDRQINYSNDPQYLQFDYYINSGDSVFLQGNVSVLNPYSTFSWSPCESIVSDCFVADGFWAKPTTTTVYHLTAIDEHNCSETFPSPLLYFYKVHVDVDDTGIGETSFNKISIYPNPTSSGINIVLPENSTQTSTIFVNDLSGRLLLTEIFMGNQHYVSLNSLSGGIYIVSIQNDQKVWNKRVVINR
ncbi:MAG: T9SS type A sorting domain-containing protein [Lentimicrobiaceae bacterium]|jgi:hypothetical protein|nr:T9SS type A sorting domain-containing protein [Lentimicrobiaceae bacterium]